MGSQKKYDADLYVNFKFKGGSEREKGWYYNGAKS